MDATIVRIVHTIPKYNYRIIALDAWTFSLKFSYPSTLQFYRFFYCHRLSVLPLLSPYFVNFSSHRRSVLRFGTSQEVQHGSGDAPAD